jgi:hypothetical protein
MRGRDTHLAHGHAIGTGLAPSPATALGCARHEMSDRVPVFRPKPAAGTYTQNE